MQDLPVAVLVEHHDGETNRSALLADDERRAAGNAWGMEGVALEAGSPDRAPLASGDSRMSISSW